MTSKGRQRLFFALWPDDDTRRALAALARSQSTAGGRFIPPENLHLTLVFLGSRDAGFRACAEQAAERVSAPEFVLEFRRMGHWPRPRVLWSAPESTPDALIGLASALNDALVACGHEPESRSFGAHVTLARKVRGPVAETSHAPVHWRVAEFHLVESVTHPRGARYRCLKSWPLG